MADDEKETRDYAQRNYTADFFRDRKAHKDSKSGVLGITTIKRRKDIKYRAELQFRGERWNGPYRDTLREAKEDRDRLVREVIEKCARS